LEILKLIERSEFDFIEVQVGEIKLSASRRGASGPPRTNSPDPKRESAENSRTFSPIERPASSEEPFATGDALTIKAPMVGTFYSAPAPGAEPFVRLGSEVGPDATVGLIETMKVFTAVKSGLSGTVARICVTNGDFVEYGQTLFIVRPGAGTVTARDPES
jgi:acetyl-CoA carboxylase biotin carboxyl carrier protein